MVSTVPPLWHYSCVAQEGGVVGTFCTQRQCKVLLLGAGDLGMGNVNRGGEADKTSQGGTSPQQSARLGMVTGVRH